MAPKRKPEGPLGAATKQLKQGSLFSFFKPAASAAQTTSQAAASAAPAASTAVESERTAPTAAAMNPEIAKIQLGGRIEVFWADDDEFYAAKVSKKRDASTFYLEYEDGQAEWIDLATETFRFPKENMKKRQRIQEDDDEEAEFEMPSDSDDDDDSAYDDKNEAEQDEQNEEEDDDDDQWIVSDDEDHHVAGKTIKTLRVSSHKTPARKPASAHVSQQSSRSTNQSSIAATPKHVTPAVSSSQLNYRKNQTNSSSSSSPTDAIYSVVNNNNNFSQKMHTSTPIISGAPLMYEKNVVNPPGSHVHNHLRFLDTRYKKDAQGRTMDHPDHDLRTLLVSQAELKQHYENVTAGVQQWWDLKAQYYDTVLLFKTGKFYELYHMDADIGVQVCGFAYMKGHIAHCGFPEAAYGKFVDMLIRAGYKVARVEQTETPEQLQERKKKHKGKGGVPKVVNREVCSILTAGTRTFCVLDRVDGMEETSPLTGVGPLMAIREVLMEPIQSQDKSEELPPVCEYGVTIVDAVTGTVTVGQFADDVLRSRMDTLILTFRPSEILLQGGADGASPTLRAMLHSLQTTSRNAFQIEDIRSNENFPKSTALDAEVRRQLERRGIVHPWDVKETLDEIHRRRYYPRASKKEEDRFSVSRWPHILRALVEGNAELALSSFGAALYYLQRSLIDSELLTMGIVKAYIPPASSAAQERADGQIGLLASQGAREEGAIDSRDDTASVAAAQCGNSQSAFMDTNLSSQLNDEDNITNMALDGTTLMNLEILTNNVDYKAFGSLWSIINHSKTPHGGRLLRAWLLRPLFRKADIQRRTDAVEELVSGSAAVALSEAFSVLAKCGDIERLLSRVHSMGGNSVGGADDDDDDIPEGVHPSDRAVLYETATYTRRMVSDFSKLLNGLRQVTRIPEIFNGIEIRSGLLHKIVRLEEQGGCFPDMAAELDWFFDNFDCDKAAKGLFEPTRGVDAEYDDACETIEQIKAQLEDYKNEMCSKCLSPASLARSSWKYVNTSPDSKDKFLIELPINVAVPDDFLVKGKRGSGAKQVNKYRSTKVDHLVQELDHAYEIQKARKALGMKLIFTKFDSMRPLWAAAGQATALLDALGSLAKTSTNGGYSRATILDCPPDGSSSIRVVQGRHPIVEKALKSGEFVPNDLELGSNDKRILLLSGVNMGGKSTCLRQTCLLAIMAQIGCFVPADSFELTPVDRIYTRLGASDRILMGQSTFFVELAETAAALRGATRRSLVIMDELGRGTSTFDGTAIASATVKHLVERTRCISLFATHYHSLLDEWQDHPGVFLGHMECVVENGQITTRGDTTDESTITFLYTLGEGGCPKSFGINVARLAGLPAMVVSNAHRISADFEREMKEGASSNVMTVDKARDVKLRFLAALESPEWEQKVRALKDELK